jgi:hypothetical protein
MINATIEERLNKLQAALEAIEAWSRAYPLEAFPEPDLERAAELLSAGGMSIDAISASAIRHVVKSIGEIARKALAAAALPAARLRSCNGQT